MIIRIKQESEIIMNNSLLTKVRHKVSWLPTVPVSNHNRITTKYVNCASILFGIMTVLYSLPLCNYIILYPMHLMVTAKESSVS